MSWRGVQPLSNICSPSPLGKGSGDWTATYQELRVTCRRALERQCLSGNTGTRPSKRWATGIKGNTPTAPSFYAGSHPAAFHPSGPPERGEGHGWREDEDELFAQQQQVIQRHGLDERIDSHRQAI